MATTHPTDTPNQAFDPAQLGGETEPTTPARDDSHDMTTVLADADSAQGRPFASQPVEAPQGSEFNQQRQQGATADPDHTQANVGPGQGMGRTSDGDEDRGYDQSGIRGGLGSSGGARRPQRPPAPCRPEPIHGWLRWRRYRPAPGLSNAAARP